LYKLARREISSARPASTRADRAEAVELQFEQVIRIVKGLAANR
jgi:hypothetical protein